MFLDEGWCPEVPFSRYSDSRVFMCEYDGEYVPLPPIYIEVHDICNELLESLAIIYRVKLHSFLS